MAVNLLLLGRNGNGKSSTGNSILGTKAFTPRSSSQATVDEILIRTADLDDKTISVVEGPGIGDTNVNDINDVRLTISNVKKALEYCPGGFQAIICVFKYGVRFTNQEKDTISLIKSIFGENVFKVFGVIVMTYGDSFAMDMEEENTTFETWCKQQTGDIEELFEECKHRYVLFNNRTKDELLLSVQRDTLMTIVDKMSINAVPYTLAEFYKAEAGRNRILVFSKLSRLQEENRRVLEEISNKLREIDVTSEWSVAYIKTIEQEINDHKLMVEGEASSTDIMKNILEEIKITELNLRTKLSMAELEKKRRRRAEEEIEQKRRNNERGVCPGITQEPENEQTPLIGRQQPRGVETFSCVNFLKYIFCQKCY